MQTLPGFRDFYPDACALRTYILSTWREVARRYGFAEFDGPTAEPLALYEKKSGGELVGQLFLVTHAGAEGVPTAALRPEMTPTLARMIAARDRDYRKPMKWFCAPQCFRHERQQRGRLREFFQFNADIVGDASPGADAELLALAVDLLRAFGFTERDVVVRVSDRGAWSSFAAAHGIAPERLPDFLAAVDKLERVEETVSREKCAAFGVTLDDVRAFIADPGKEAPGLARLQADLEARGMGGFVQVDLAVVRGLAYYTGLVFEVFDRAKSERAIAGGGRYDTLLALMSDGKVDLPALGFGMGDVVLANLIEAVPEARAKRDAWLSTHASCEIYVVVADENRRAEAVRLVQRLRDAGWRTDFALAPAKVAKQFQAAESCGAAFAAVVGLEWPTVKIKTLATRDEAAVGETDVVEHLRRAMRRPPS